MNVLALESSTKVVSIALVSNGNLVARSSSAAGKSSSSEMTPMLGRLFEESGWHWHDVDLIALSIGPGSFTGLRIGVVAAKALAYAQQIPVVSVNTLQAVAQAAAEHAIQERSLDGRQWVVCPAINAQRRQLFVGRYGIETASGQITTVSQEPVSIVDRAEWVSSLLELKKSRRPLLTGLGLKLLSAEIEELEAVELKAVGLEAIEPEVVELVAPSLWTPCVEQVAKLGQRQFEAEQTEDYMKIQPLYFRPSAAEEKRLAKMEKESG